MKVGDIAEIVVLDTSTALIGEYKHVKILEINGADLLVCDAWGQEAWVTIDHLELVNDLDLEI